MHVSVRLLICTCFSMSVRAIIVSECVFACMLLHGYMLVNACMLVCAISLVPVGWYVLVHAC